MRETAETALKQRTVPVEFLLGVEVSAIRPNVFEYKRDQQTHTINAGTIIWTTGTNTHPLIKTLPIPDEHRDKHGRLNVTPTLQLPDFPDVFAGGDCAVDLQPALPQHDHYESPQHQPYPELKPLPPTAQVAYQQGYAVAHNLRALALGCAMKPARVNIRGTLLKVGLEESIASLFNQVEVTGELGHLIRQGTYLELLPTPLHDFKATTEWLKQELFERQSSRSLKQVVKAAEIVGGVVTSAIIAKKLLNALTNDSPSET